MTSILRRLLGGDKAVKDHVCGMTISPSQARDFSVYHGTTYHFCSRACREQFEREPERYVGAGIAETT